MSLPSLLVQLKSRICFLCSLMPSFYIEGPSSNPLCSIIHLSAVSAGGSQLLWVHYCTTLFCVCLDWPKFCTCAHQCTTSVSVYLEGPMWYVLTNAPLLIWRGPILFPCAQQCTLSVVSVEGSQLLCAHYCTTSSVSVWIGPKFVFVLTNALRL